MAMDIHGMTRRSDSPWRFRKRFFFDRCSNSCFEYVERFFSFRSKTLASVTVAAWLGVVAAAKDLLVGALDATLRSSRIVTNVYLGIAFEPVAL